MDVFAGRVANETLFLAQSALIVCASWRDVVGLAFTQFALRAVMSLRDVDGAILSLAKRCKLATNFIYRWLACLFVCVESSEARFLMTWFFTKAVTTSEEVAAGARTKKVWRSAAIHELCRMSTEARFFDEMR